MNIKKIISIALFVIAVVLIVFGFYMLNSNKYIFKTVLSKSLDAGVEKLFEENVLLEDISKAEKLKVTTETKLNMLEQDMIALNGDVYFNGDEMYFYLDSKFLNEDFLNVEALANTEKIYFNFKDAIDQFYYIDLEPMIDAVDLDQYSVKSDITKKDVEVLTNHLEKSILQDLKDDDFNKNSETLIFDGKTYNTNKISLNLSTKEIRQIVVNLLENIINDKAAIQVLQKFDNSITAEGLTEILEAFEQESANASDNDVLNISFYIKGFSDLVRVEVLTLNNNIDSVATDNLLVTIDRYKNKDNNDTTKFIFKTNNVVLFDIKLIKLSETLNNFEITVNDGEDIVLLKGDYDKTNESINLNCDLLYNNEKIGVLTYTLLLGTKNKDYKMDVSFKTVDNSISFITDNNLLINESIPEIDLDNAKDLNNIDEEESNTLLEYFYDKFEFMGLEDYLNKNPDAYKNEDIIE